MTYSRRSSEGDPRYQNTGKFNGIAADSVRTGLKYLGLKLSVPATVPAALTAVLLPTIIVAIARVPCAI
ncbi:MAG: hypothetical protein GDA56_23735 [Hormoscilla sp. GM7CHS1pb]|nr:hypothetical protein [Hormoscilla sp. GM7CHS1pb]